MASRGEYLFFMLTVRPNPFAIDYCWRFGATKFRLVALQPDHRRRFLVVLRFFDDDHMAYERFLAAEQRSNLSRIDGQLKAINIAYSSRGLLVRRLGSSQSFVMSSSDPMQY